VKHNLIFGEEVKYQYQKSTLSTSNSQKKFINIKSETQQKWSFNSKNKPVKALPIAKKEVKKSTFYVKPFGQDLLKQIEDEVLEEIKSGEKEILNPGFSKKSSLPIVHRAKSTKNNILIRAPKLKGFVEMNISNVNNSKMIFK